VETVIRWLNRDYLDDTPTGNRAYPCVPNGSSTCLLLDEFYSIGGGDAEVLLRTFGNLALRHHDGTPRPSEAIWRDYISRPYRP
jgi:hypothetical protein